MSLEDMIKAFEELGFEAYRARQVYKWLYSGQLDFEEMSNLPKDMRKILTDNFINGGLTVTNRLVSKIDGTRKYLLNFLMAI